MPDEPTLEVLSSYLDHELDASTEARVAEHVAGCTGCKARLDGLRQAAYAIRALPMETPTRTFTVPEKRRPAFRWAPVGWLGGAAAALLIVAVGVQQLHPLGRTTAATSSGAGTHALQPVRSGNQSNDKSGAASQAFAARVNTVTVVDPLNSSRSLTLSTDSNSYSASGSMTVRVRLAGLASGRTGIVGLLLERNGYAVQLPTGSGPSDAAGFEASYQFANLDLSNPVAGSYTLMAIEQLPGNGDSLIARLPLTITP